MPTAPKVKNLEQRVSTALPSAPVTTTAYHGSVNPYYEVDPRNRKERRKAESGKRNKRRVLGDDTVQRSIYNAFRGY